MIQKKVTSELFVPSFVFICNDLYLDVDSIIKILSSKSEDDSKFSHIVKHVIT